MKTFYGLLLSSAFALSALSQDKIVLHSGEVLQGKVEEVGLSEIKYKKQDNLNGPVYILPKADVHAIHYENGSKDEFAKKEEKKNDDYVTKDKPTNDREDDVYSDGKGQKKKSKREHRQHNNVDIIVPVWQAVGWLIFADILFGCF